MPTVFFAKSQGRVVRLIDPSVPCVTRFYGFGDRGDKISFQDQRSIVTRLTLSQSTNTQFLHTLGSRIYIYNFGDQIGRLGLSGLGFGNPCTGGGCDDMTGLEGMYQWYRKNRASTRKRPVEMMIGSQPLEGTVVNFNADIIEAASGLVQWELQLATVPER